MLAPGDESIRATSGVSRHRARRPTARRLDPRPRASRRLARILAEQGDRTPRPGCRLLGCAPAGQTVIARALPKCSAALGANRVIYPRAALLSPPNSPTRRACRSRQSGAGPGARRARADRCGPCRAAVAAARRAPTAARSDSRWQAGADARAAAYDPRRRSSANSPRSQWHESPRPTRNAQWISPARRALEANRARVGLRSGRDGGGPAPAARGARVVRRGAPGRADRRALRLVGAMAMREGRWVDVGAAIDRMSERSP